MLNYIPRPGSNVARIIESIQAEGAMTRRMISDRFGIGLAQVGSLLRVPLEHGVLAVMRREADRKFIFYAPNRGEVLVPKPVKRSVVVETVAPTSIFDMGAAIKRGFVQSGQLHEESRF